MRFLLISIFLLAGLQASLAQACVNPIDKASFQEGFNLVAVQSTPAKKISLALIFIKDKCLQAAQVKTMAQLFTDDAGRFDFCKAAYERTTDKNNFYDVYDAFEKISYAFRLHDFVQSISAPQTPAPVSPLPVEQVLTFPRYSYPSSLNYKGVRGCQGPVVNNDEFMKIANNVYIQPTDEARQLAIQNAAKATCLDFAQAMKLSAMVSSEELKLKTLIAVFPQVYDLESYKSGIALFTNKNLQTEWLNFGAFQLAPPVEVCEESDADFEKVMKNLRTKFFDHERIKLIETLAIDHCFKVSQIKTMVNEISAAARKPDLLKKLYDKCPDKKNFYLLADDLFFASDKQDLENFIRSKSK